MPCKKCRSDFNLFNWKIKCGECDDKYCTKCLKKREGVLYCEKCIILLKRPPDRHKLMELKPKDLQDYLNKHNISTYGLVEKHELVDLFCQKHIPEKPKRGVEKLTANFAGTVPNFHLNEFLENFETVIPTELRSSSRATVPVARPTSPAAGQSTSRRQSPSEAAAPPPEPPEVASPPSEPQPTTSGGVQEDESQEPETTSSPPKQEEPTPDSSPLPPRYPRLSDFEGLEGLDTLSSKQLKQLLTLNRVDFKGCVEKIELLDRAKRLWQDNHEQKKDLPENVLDLCKLCMDAPLDCVLLECGHIATCIDCGKRLSECPICRQYVIRVVRTFKA